MQRPSAPTLIVVRTASRPPRRSPSHTHRTVDRRWGEQDLAETFLWSAAVCDCIVGMSQLGNVRIIVGLEVMSVEGQLVGRLLGVLYNDSVGVRQESNRCTGFGLQDAVWRGSKLRSAPLSPSWRPDQSQCSSRRAPRPESNCRSRGGHPGQRAIGAQAPSRNS
eukprot:353394-Chlamydomonas_euryale.AAC.6